MRGLPRLIAPLLVLAAVAAGCGGGESDGAAGSTPGSQVRAYLAAFERGDGRAACALLTPEARAGVPHLSDDIEAPDCEHAIRELARTTERLRSPRISVDVQGERATARIASTRPPYQSQALLREQNGSWRIAFPPAVLQRYKTPPGIPSELDENGKKPG
jgi:hypothetical protein